MIETPAFTVSANGISAPTYEEILEFFKQKAYDIFGSDIDLDADTQDGQLIAVFAAAIHDVNSAAIQVFNAYNPTTATGIALDGAVKTNGLTRQDGSYSQVDLRIIGQFGTVIKNGVAIDNEDRKWLLPETVTIPSRGEVTVTATAKEIGAIRARAGSISKIGTPTLGWQSVTNPEDAAVGVDVETDEELRERQAVSTMQPTMGFWDGLVGSIMQLDDVQSVNGRHNDTGEATLDGIPAHSIALVVSGGDAQEIAEIIYRKKTQGVATHGSTTVEHVDELGNIYDIKFSRPHIVPVTVSLQIEARESWLSTVEDDIKARVSAYINSLPVGVPVDIAKLTSVVTRSGQDFDQAFYLKEIKISDVIASKSISWDQKAEISVSDISVEVV